MPRVHSSMVLVFAFASGLVAFLISMSLVNPPKQERSPDTLMVVGAVRDIEIGTMITSEDVDLFPAPKGVNPKVLFTDFKKVVEHISNRDIVKGEVIRNIDLLKEGDNLATLIPRGYRAMTIPVTLPAGMTGLIKTGNRVDVLLSYKDKEKQFKSVSVAENAKVISVDESGKGNKKSITLAVTPTGAETLAYAMKRGSLDVAVHSTSDKNKKERFFTLGELFFSSKKGPVVQAKTEPVYDGVEIIRGLRKEKHRFRRTIVAQNQSAQTPIAAT